MRAVGEADALAFSLYAGGRPEAVWWTRPDHGALDLEDAQYVVGEGPTVEAAETGRPVLVPDICHMPQRRWPLLLADPDVGTKLRALIALPVHVEGEPVGVLAAYRRVPDLPSREAIRALKAIAREIGSLLERAPLEVPMLHRAVVHQAAGVLADACGLGLEEAADQLLAQIFAARLGLIDGSRRILRQLRAQH
ncbi:hypothetical protein BIV57_00735 [Mangrovactinospora gilvigrisea]|uniref:GAF domain-containing protein n=2 Tax=Mangrovactinospora gilvigrisea TaxID=1428644 RepID=A0A1J7CCX0_9ACTN|nr:hypothetical protein BIV57_00735 [Mangrovactinospora gilvigrisea]